MLLVMAIANKSESNIHLILAATLHRFRIKKSGIDSECAVKHELSRWYTSIKELQRCCNECCRDVVINIAEML
jgi:hypothetical protein